MTDYRNMTDDELHRTRDLAGNTINYNDGQTIEEYFDGTVEGAANGAAQGWAVGGGAGALAEGARGAAEGFVGAISNHVQNILSNHRTQQEIRDIDFELGLGQAGLMNPVTSRKVVWLFPEQLGLELVPVLHCLQG